MDIGTLYCQNDIRKAIFNATGLTWQQYERKGSPSYHVVSHSQQGGNTYLRLEYIIKFLELAEFPETSIKDITTQLNNASIIDNLEGIYY